MGAIFLAIAPVFTLILLGYGLRRGVLMSDDFWAMTDRLVYRVLMPALLIVQISATDFRATPLTDFALILYAGFFAAIAFGIGAQRLAGLGPVSGSSVMQGCCRFNTFTGLAIAEALYGHAALQLAVVGAALLVPVINVTLVFTMSVMLHAGGPPSPRRIAGELARNPLILGILIGTVLSLSGLSHIPVLGEALKILGGAALPVMLLCVGANMKVRGMHAVWLPVVLSCAGKFVVFPAAIMAAAVALGAGVDLIRVAVIFGALPTAVSAYSLARQMGGDAPLMAAIITLQTLVAFVTIPLTLALVERVAG